MNMKNQKCQISILGLVFLIVLCQCSNLQVIRSRDFEPKIQKILADSGDQILILKKEDEKHQKILHHLNHKPTTEWKSLKTPAQNLYQEAHYKYEQSLKTLGAFKAASVDYTTFAYSYPEVHSHQSEWKEALNWQNRLELLNQSWNEAQQQATQKYNQLNQFWSQNSLFKKASGRKLAIDLQNDTQEWRTHYQLLTNEFYVTQNQFNDWAQRLPSQTSIHGDLARMRIEKMHSALDIMSGLIKKLDELKENYLLQFEGRNEITSIESDWKDWNHFNNQRTTLVESLSSTMESCQKFKAQAHQIMQDPGLPSAQLTPSESNPSPVQ